MRLRGTTFALGAAVLAGVSGTVAADAFQRFDPVEVAQFRQMAAAIVVGLVAYRRGATSTAGRLPELGLIGAAIASVTLTLYWAIERLGVGPAVTIAFLGPVLVLVWLRVVEQRPVPGATWVAAAAAVAGTALVTQAWDIDSLDRRGLVAAGASAVSMAAYLVLGERLGRRLPGLTIGAYGFAVAALLLVVAAPPSLPSTDATGWLQLGWIAIGGTVGPFLLNLEGLRRDDAGRIGVVATAEVVVAAATAWWWLGEHMSPAQLAGAAVVVVSVAAVQRLRSG